MIPNSAEKLSFVIGVLFSLVAHLLVAVIAIFVFESSAAEASRRPEVFTITIEGGERLGGISQVPEPESKAPKVLPNQPEQPPEEEINSEEKPTVEEKTLTAPSAVEDPEKILQEKKAQELKLLEEKKKQAQEREKQLIEDQEKKKKLELEKKKQDEIDKKKAQEQKLKEKKARDAKLQAAIKAAKKRYEGESANAGGEGFGAARVGGTGMGGGTLQSLEYIAYRNELERLIKGGWRWLPGRERLQAKVVIYIMPTGDISHVNLDLSSGNDNFDDSALRAVQKASPVPPAPAHLYEDFKEVRITFDSQE